VTLFDTHLGAWRNACCAPFNRLRCSAGLLQLPRACGDAAGAGHAGSGAASLRAWLLALELMEDEDDEVGSMTDQRQGLGFCGWRWSSWKMRMTRYANDSGVKLRRLQSASKQARSCDALLLIRGCSIVCTAVGFAS
jgi:hypothetical protein